MSDKKTQTNEDAAISQQEYKITLEKWNIALSALALEDRAAIEAGLKQAEHREFERICGAAKRCGNEIGECSNCALLQVCTAGWDMRVMNLGMLSQFVETMRLVRYAIPPDEGDGDDE